MKRNVLTIGAIAMITSASFALAQGGDKPTFDALDADGNGLISQAEMEAAGEIRFNRIDANADGLLSKEEIIAQQTARASSRVDRMIDRLDTDSDGQLSQAELEARPRRGEVFSRLDANDDGSISKDEFENGRKHMRKRMRGRHSDKG